MQKIEYRLDDKSTWGDGPWQSEPDMLLWVDPQTGLQCMIARADFGHLCGYVGLLPGHPLHGKEYRNIALHAHGDINFANEFSLASLRLDPPLNDSTPLWWLGFDCGHSWDFSPGMAAHIKELGISNFDGIELFNQPQRYCIIDYVFAEVTDLAAQLHALATKECQ
jgi:hypothetical protein